MPEARTALLGGSSSSSGRQRTDNYHRSPFVATRMRTSKSNFIINLMPGSPDPGMRLIMNFVQEAPGRLLGGSGKLPGDSWEAPGVVACSLGGAQETPGRFPGDSFPGVPREPPRSLLATKFRPPEHSWVYYQKIIKIDFFVPRG